jgi:hypothetical protein
MALPSRRATVLELPELTGHPNLTDRIQEKLECA